VQPGATPETDPDEQRAAPAATREYRSIYDRYLLQELSRDDARREIRGLLGA
jgi:NADPH-dependent 7-cyano-7-deazaguanine reductase QueF-like protein